MWIALVDSIQKLAAAKQVLEEEMDDVPDDFQCCIMATIMRDPVKLRSGSTMNQFVVVDRSSIEAALRSGSNTNPYTRQPMKAEDIVPYPELKEKITKWLKDQRN